MKIVLFILLLIFAGRSEALPSYVSFCSQGAAPDTYIDGTVVADGEVYACVWIKNGCSFAGIMADGQLVDKVNNKLVGAAPLAENGRCKPVVFMLNGENADLPAGTFEIYLFDTRVKPTQDAVPVPAGLGNTERTGALRLAAASKTLTAVNGYAAVGATSKTLANEALAVHGPSAESVLPDDLPRPVIKSIRVINAKVVLTVGNTMPFVRYGIASGRDAKNLTKNFKVPGANGAGEGGELTLVIDQAQEHKFFKVIRN